MQPQEALHYPTAPRGNNWEASETDRKIYGEFERVATLKEQMCIGVPCRAEDSMAGRPL